MILRDDITNTIDIYQKATRPNCSYEITGSKVIVEQGPVKMEEWTVIACGEEIVYTVKTGPTESGGTVLVVGMK